MWFRAFGGKGKSRLWLRGTTHESRHVLADCGAMLESMSLSPTSNPDILQIGMPVDQEIAR